MVHGSSFSINNILFRYLFIFGLITANAILIENTYAEGIYTDYLSANLEPVANKSEDISFKVRNILFSSDIYQGFDIREENYDLQGWFGTHRVFYEMIEAIKPKLIVEVGTWKGESAVTMARALQSLNLNSEIVCVDTFLGAGEHIGGIPRNFGYPTIYQTFINNVLVEKLQNYITPFPMTSHIASQWFQDNNILVDLIYIDASHDYEDVLNDIKDWLKVLKPGGVIIGDDYYWGDSANNAPSGVHKAVNEIRLSRPELKFLGVEDNVKWGFQKL